MSQDPRQFSAMFSIDVSADPRTEASNQSKIDANELIVALLRQMLEGQKREITLLEEISTHLGHGHKQRQHELNQWKEANPKLSQACRYATETLSKVQTQFLENITQDVFDNEESLGDSDFVLNEFVDRFGPRLAHLNGVLQVLSQLSAAPPAPVQNPS
jgi:predicted DsbA family dithiol-disulfide isomerase